MILEFQDPQVNLVFKEFQELQAIQVTQAIQAIQAIQDQWVLKDLQVSEVRMDFKVYRDGQDIVVFQENQVGQAGQE